MLLFIQCVEVILGGVDYDEGRVNEWMSAVVEQSLTHLVKLEKTYKYIGKLIVAIMLNLIALHVVYSDLASECQVLVKLGGLNYQCWGPQRCSSSTRPLNSPTCLR